MRIETDRLLIRNFTMADVPQLQRILADPEVMRYLEPPYTPEQTRAFVRDAGLCEPPRVYAVCRKDTGRLIGHVIFHPYNRYGDYEIGWVLAQAQWRQGYADELTDALIRQAATQGVPELVLECSPRQTVSMRIAQGHGFSKRGMENGRAVYRLRLPCAARREE